jgi:hypothetical protein
MQGDENHPKIGPKFNIRLYGVGIRYIGTGNLVVTGMPEL